MKFDIKSVLVLPLGFRRLFALCAVFALVGGQVLKANLDPQAEAILKKARQFISDEPTLNGVRSLRFEGTITNPDGKTGKISISLQQPYKLMQSIQHDNGMVDEFGLNDYEGWLKRFKTDNPEVYALMPVDVARLKRLRANTYEGLNFFSTKTNYGRKIEYLGKEDLDGKPVEVVKILYGSAIFVRYFDEETGELLLSEIENGERIQEQGELMVSGIRFPKYLITFRGDEQISHLEFNKIEVNPVFEDSLFTQPPLPSLRKK